MDAAGGFGRQKRAFASVAQERWPCVCGKPVSERWKRRKPLLSASHRIFEAVPRPAPSCPALLDGPYRGREGSSTQRISLQRAALLRVFLAAQRVPSGTFAFTQIVGKSGEKLASSEL